MVVPTKTGYEECWPGHSEAKGRYWNNLAEEGLGRQVVARWPFLPNWYGQRCQEYGSRVPVLLRPDLRLLFLPTRQIAEPLPNPDLIRGGLNQIRHWWEQWEPRIALPLVGTGSGLSRLVARDLIIQHLGHTHVVLVDRKPTLAGRVAAAKEQGFGK